MDQSLQTFGNNVLLTVSGAIPPEIERDILLGLRPRADFLELARRVGADILDHERARAVTGKLGRILDRLVGSNVVLAVAICLLRKRYKAVFTDGEQVGLPLAALLRLTRGKRPRHVMIVHIISVRKKIVLLDLLRLHTCIDRFLVYSTWQKVFIETRWNICPKKVVWTPFMVDHLFFCPSAAKHSSLQQPQICAVGLERRDYLTLLQAVDGLPVDVVIAAASPWSKRQDNTREHRIPKNVRVSKFSQFELRELYRTSQFMVMPLEDVDFQAGVTAILEAMAMGKAVICSQTRGQTDVIVDGENGIYVPPADPAALRSAIVSLLKNPDEAARLGANGRKLVEQRMNLDAYVNRLSQILAQTIDEADST